MRRLGVIGAPGGWYVRDLLRAAGDRWQLEPLAFSQIAARIEGARTAARTETHDLGAFDGLLVRSMPPGSLEQVVFRMNALHRVAATGCPIYNPPRCLEVAIDKYLTSSLLQAHGVPTPPTMVSQTIEAAMDDFHQLGQDVVLKPLFGGEGRGITRIQDEAIAERVFRTLIPLGQVMYQQAFIAHPGYDWRVLVLGRDKMFGMSRVNPTDWRTNVSRGATVERLEIDSSLGELALRAAEATGVPMAGVDILPALDGRRYVLEVNAVPGWRGLARACACDIAHEMLLWIEQQLVAAGR